MLSLLTGIRKSNRCARPRVPFSACFRRFCRGHAGCLQAAAGFIRSAGGFSAVAAAAAECPRPVCRLQLTDGSLVRRGGDGSSLQFAPPNILGGRQLETHYCRLLRTPQLPTRLPSVSCNLSADSFLQSEFLDPVADLIS